HFIHPPAEHLLRRAIPTADVPLEVERDNGQRGGLNHRSKSLVNLDELFLRFPPVGDVAAVDHDTRYGGIVEQAAADGLEHTPAPIRAMADSELNRLGARRAGAGGQS